MKAAAALLGAAATATARRWSRCSLHASLARLALRRRQHAQLRELMALEQHQLNDLGIGRSELASRVAAGRRGRKRAPGLPS